MKAGDHLMRMSVQAFRYMADAHAKGELVPDYEVPEQKPVQARGQGTGPLIRPRLPQDADLCAPQAAEGEAPW